VAAQRRWEASVSAIRRPVGRAEDGRPLTAWRVTSRSNVHSALIGAIRERSNWVSIHVEGSNPNRPAAFTQRMFVQTKPRDAALGVTRQILGLTRRADRHSQLIAAPWRGGCNGFVVQIGGQELSGGRRCD
jgi:hypothetical protein